MAVTFTPNIGLAKPTEAELAKDWVIEPPNLAKDNNLIIIDKMLVDQLSWTPAFIAATSNPSIGVGTKIGEYIDFQGFIMGSFVFQPVDAGVAAGSGAGAYGISLPTLVDTTFHTVGSSLSDLPGIASIIGEGYIDDASAIATSGTVAVDVVAISGVHYARLITESYPAKTSYFFGPGAPFSLATGDNFSCSFMYKKA